MPNSAENIQPRQQVRLEKIKLLINQWPHNEIFQPWGADPSAQWLVQLCGSIEELPFICNVIRESTGEHLCIFSARKNGLFQETMRFVIAKEEGNDLSLWLEQR